MSTGHFQSLNLGTCCKSRIHIIIKYGPTSRVRRATRVTSRLLSDIAVACTERILIRVALDSPGSNVLDPYLYGGREAIRT
jgi:hypothetical protein